MDIENIQKCFGFENDNIGLLMISLTLIPCIQKYYSFDAVNLHEQMNGDPYTEK
jgi:hypothetical protein